MRVAWLVVLLALSACGHSSSPTLSVSCGGSTALVGATSVDVNVDAVSKTTVLTFPDPINSDRTGTIAVQRKCTIMPSAPS